MATRVGHSLVVDVCVSFDVYGMKHPPESWLWMFVLGGIGSAVIVSVYGQVQTNGWGFLPVLGIPIAFFCFYLMFYEWEHPLS